MLPRPSIMPILTGSPRQVAWAETVCAKRIPDLLALAGNDCERGYAEALILQTTSANWWIDRRGEDSSSLARQMVHDFASRVPRPADGTVSPDLAAVTVMATDMDRLVAKAQASIERQPFYRYSSAALAARIAAGLAPGDTWTQSDRRAVYLGNRQIMAQRLGQYRVALETRIVDATDDQLDAMLITLGERAATAAVAAPAIKWPAPPSAAGGKPKPPRTILRRALVLADSVEVGGARGGSGCWWSIWRRSTSSPSPTSSR